MNMNNEQSAEVIRLLKDILDELYTIEDEVKRK